MDRNNLLGLLIMMLSYLLPGMFSDISASKSPENKVTIVYNNIAGSKNHKLISAGGFSTWVEFNDKTILFDAGGDTSILIGNLEELGLDINELDAIFISHNHWDHVYGLPRLLGAAAFKPVVYVSKAASISILEQNPRATVIPVDEPAQIFPQIWSTGEMKIDRFKTVVSEQALILEDSEGIYIITGCAHPGIVKLIERSKEICHGKPVKLVTGGFHLIDHSAEDVIGISKTFKQLDVEIVAPSHCTGQHAIRYFQDEWQSDFIQLYLGDEYQF